MPVEADHQIVRNDGITGRKEGHQALDEMPLGGCHAGAQVTQVDLEVDLLDAPGVLDGRAIHFVEARITHGAQREIETGIEQTSGGAHWQASQLCGFSSEQAMAWTSDTGALARTVVLAICVAGRERR